MTRRIARLPVDGRLIACGGRGRREDGAPKRTSPCAVALVIPGGAGDKADAAGHDSLRTTAMLK
jgi:hypothetical protein